MLPSLGQQLRHTRVQRGLTLLDAAHETRIPAAKIKDLEEDIYTSFGSLTYAKSFLKTYSSFLEVNANAILEQIQPPPLGGESSYSYLTRNLGTWLRPRQVRPHAHARPSATQRGSYLTMSLIGGAVLMLGVSMLLGGSIFKAKEPAPASTEVTVVKAIPVLSEEQTNAGQTSWAGGNTANTVSNPVTSPETPVPAAVPLDVPPDKVVDSTGKVITPVKAVPVE